MFDERTILFSRTYSDPAFWNKVLHFAKAAGREVIERALQLYYAAQHAETPAWAKTVIYGALGYFIFPVDTIPDTVPVIGFTDDLGVLIAAITTVAMHVNEDVKDRARKKLKDWFGE